MQKKEKNSSFCSMRAVIARFLVRSSRNLVTKTANQLRKRAGAMKGIQLLLGKLEFLLTIVMFGLIIFVYSKSFNL